VIFGSAAHLSPFNHHLSLCITGSFGDITNCYSWFRWRSYPATFWVQFSVAGVSMKYSDVVPTAFFEFAERVQLGE
jgi:hypothetical protein